MCFIERDTVITVFMNFVKLLNLKVTLNHCIYLHVLVLSLKVYIFLKKCIYSFFDKVSSNSIRQASIFNLFFFFYGNPGFPASRVIPWVRSGSGPASPGKVCPEPEGPVPASWHGWAVRLWLASNPEAWQLAPKALTSRADSSRHPYLIFQTQYRLKSLVVYIDYNKWSLDVVKFVETYITDKKRIQINILGLKNIWPLIQLLYTL